MNQFFHFTKVSALPAILKYGPVLGSVLDANTGRTDPCVWLTTNGDGKLLRGDARGPEAYRIRLTLENVWAVRLEDWAKELNCWEHYMRAIAESGIPLTVVAEWYLCFDQILPRQIMSFSEDGGEEFTEIDPRAFDLDIPWVKGVRFSERLKWLKRQVRKDNADKCDALVEQAKPFPDFVPPRTLTMIPAWAGEVV